MITIVDYGMGNLGSVQNMFRRIGVPARITSDCADVESAEKLLLPGVGAFDSAMERIDASGLRPVLDYKVMDERTPVLGICLGLQLLTLDSEEGQRPGLGWIAARTRRFPKLPGLKVPHMGWNLVTSVRENALTQDLTEGARFYFVHSYYVLAEDRANAVLTAEYGVKFDAAVSHRNVYGAQFHPEKSHRFGMKFLSNFANL